MGNLFLINYRPKFRNGRKNTEGKVYKYKAFIGGKSGEPFGNAKEQNFFAGMVVKKKNNGEFRSFRFDRIVSMKSLG